MSKTDINSPEIMEFSVEAIELLETAESHLLNLDQGQSFLENYDAIFRVFHSLKGASGMLGLTSLQEHMHSLENHLSSQREADQLSKEQISYFLKGVDTARSFFETGGLEFAVSFPGVGESADQSQPDVSAKSNSDSISEKVRENKNEKAKLVRSKSSAKRSEKSNGIVAVVDDEEEILELLEAHLTGAGFECLSFLSAKELIDQIKEKKVDCIVTDMRMPEITGLDLMKEVNHIDPEIPLVLMSGYIDKEVLLEAISSGVFGVLEKPLESKRLIQVCRNAVQRYRLIRLLNRSINLIVYQFSDLDDYLKSKKKDDVRKVIKNELKSVLEMRKELEALGKLKI
ncbi:MAG: hypothetical protein CMJ43_18615 [Phyllobacteriaceae bacterium]|nr:hypothetical protein [Phyllobacteriaceae bacterium]